MADMVCTAVLDRLSSIRLHFSKKFWPISVTRIKGTFGNESNF